MINQSEKKFFSVSEHVFFPFRGKRYRLPFPKIVVVYQIPKYWGQIELEYMWGEYPWYWDNRQSVVAKIP